MTAIFIVCAAAGGTVMVVQFILALIGLGGEALDLDVSADADHFGGDFDVDADVGAGVDADVAGDMGDMDVGATGEFHGETHPLDHLDVPDGARHISSTWLFGVLSFRTIVAALTFFGIAGLWAESVGLSTPNVLLISIAAGGAAMMGVYWLMQSVKKLQADGNVRINRALGRHGAVYLRVPGDRSGVGKIHVNLQNRTMEYLAVTPGPELPTGARVVVTGVVNPDTLEVREEDH